MKLKFMYHNQKYLLFLNSSLCSIIIFCPLSFSFRFENPRVVCSSFCPFMNKKINIDTNKNVLFRIYIFFLSSKT